MMSIFLILFLYSTSHSADTVPVKPEEVVGSWSVRYPSIKQKSTVVFKKDQTYAGDLIISGESLKTVMDFKSCRVKAIGTWKVAAKGKTTAFEGTLKSVQLIADTLNDYRCELVVVAQTAQMAGGPTPIRGFIKKAPVGRAPAQLHLEVEALGRKSGLIMLIKNP